MKDETKSFVSGLLSGSAQTIFGHPFDTAKVLMQSNNFNKSKLKLRTLYQGIYFVVPHCMDRMTTFQNHLHSYRL